jgi:uncharacterized protein YndB with AHSA1/START domain
VEEKTPGRVSASRRISARPSQIFEVLVDPARHPEFDGTEMLRGTRTTSLITKVGDTFSMKMSFPDLRKYEMLNVVVDYELDRRIAWEPRPGDEAAAAMSGLAIGTSQGYRWGYELCADGTIGTVVTISFDCSHALPEIREAVNDGETWRPGMSESLEKLDSLFCHTSP